MDLGLKSKRALITAGSRGLGRSIAETLIQEGVFVAVVGRNQEDLTSFLNQHGSQHFAISLDLTEIGAPQKLAKALKAWGSPDIIVHNLGGTLEITDPYCGLEEWRKVYRCNLEVAIELNLLFIEQMRQNRWGRIIHTASISGLENQGPVPYCAIKAALIAYTRSFGRVVAPDGISISTVLPGAVFTEKGYWDIAQQTRPDHVKKYLDERMAIRRFGKPEEIGKTVAFLCSEAASFIVGSSFLIDGGQGRVFQNFSE